MSAQASGSFRMRLLAGDAATTRVSQLVLAAGLIVLLLLELLLFPLTVDDAYISLRYSDNLAHGRGLVWNAGEDPVEGYSNFLWVLIGAGMIEAGLPLPVSLKVLSMGLSLGTLWLLVRTARRLSPALAFPAVPALVLGATSTFALWAVAGLETALFIFLLVAALDAFLAEEGRVAQDGSGRGAVGPFWSTALFFLLALTRPEGIALFGIVAAVRLLTWFREGVRRRELRWYLAWLLVFGGLYVLYFAWRWSYFGYPLPNTAYVKARSGVAHIVAHSAVYLIPYALRLFPLLLLALFGLARSERLQRGDLVVLAALAGLFVANLAGSDWMPGHRLALPMTPLVLLLAREPLDSLLGAALKTRGWRGLAYGSLLAALALYAAAPLLYTANLYHRVMATQMDMSVYRWATEMRSIVDEQYVRVGLWLAENAPPDATVVAGNVGAIAYLSGLDVIDTIGLTDEVIARNGWTVDYLLGQRPEFLVLESDTSQGFGGLYGTGGEQFLATPAFVEQYRLLFVIDNGRTDELALFLHHLPHATWLYARQDLDLEVGR